MGKSKSNGIRGGFRGLSGAQPGPGPLPIFTCKIFLESYICPYDNTHSSHIDLLFVCITVKIQFDHTITYEKHHTHPLLGSYARSCFCPPPHSEILDPPL